jgi:hypothetical protein
MYLPDGVGAEGYRGELVELVLHALLHPEQLEVPCGVFRVDPL